MKSVFGVFLFAMFLITTSSFSYTVILKNGKTIEGTLVDQTDDLIVLRDASGIKMDFKKASVDLPKTEVANQKKDTPGVATVKEETPAAQSKPSVDASKPKKQTRVLKEADIERLRKKYDLGQGMTAKDSVQPSQQDIDAQEEVSEKERSGLEKAIDQGQQRSKTGGKQLQLIEPEVPGAQGNHRPDAYSCR